MGGEPSSDDLDPVVRTIDVYLNRLDTAEKASTYLLQYPLRPLYRPYGDHGQLCQVEKGKNSGRLKLTYALNVDGDQYDEGARAQVENLQALKAENKLTPYDEAQLAALRLHTLTASEMSFASIEYGLGFMKGDNLYLTPVDKALQMRPTFRHLDNENTSAKKDDVPSTDMGESSPKDLAASASSGLDRQLQARLKQETNSERRRQALDEPLTTIGQIYDADSPESTELVKLLSSFPVDVHVEVNEEDSDLSMSSFFDMDVGGGTGLIEADKKKKKYRIQQRRVESGKDIPVIHLNNSYEKYMTALYNGCALSALAGTGKKAAAEGSAGVATGPLSYQALSRLTLKEQTRRILAYRGVESIAGIRSLIVQRDVPEDELIAALRESAVIARGTFVVRSSIYYSKESPHSNSLGRYRDMDIMLRDLILCLHVSKKGIDRAQVQRTSQCPMDRVYKAITTIHRYENQRFVPIHPGDPEFEKAYPSACAEDQAEWSVQKASELVNKLKDLNRTEESRLRNAASGSDAIVDLLDPARLRLCFEKCLRDHGASADDFVLKEVRKAMTSMLEEDTISSLSSVPQGDSARDGILERNSLMSKALKELTIADLGPVLTQKAEKFKGLWILTSFGNQMDPFRKLFLDMYKKNPEKGISKRDFQEECLSVLRRPCDLPDYQYRSLFKEIAVNIEGYWYFKGSQKIQSREKAAEGVRP